MAAETKQAAIMEEPNSDAAAAAAALSELTALLSPSSPAAPQAAEAALALSGSPSGRALLAANPAALSALAASASRGSQPALSALVNASSEPAALEPLLSSLPSLLPLIPNSGGVCGVLANLSRDPRAAPRVLGVLGAEPVLRALRVPRPPAQLGAFLCNISQVPEGREILLDRSGELLRRMLALLRWPEVELRTGVVGALRNCCFQHEHHEWLLGPEVEALPFLLLPLAGPEELPEDEMEQLPLDLQYLPPEHQREEEPQIRKMLLETLMLLAATKAGRCHLRSQGTYLVLRGLHTWERHPGVLCTCEKVIQVLIGDEPQEGMENLLQVTVPEEVETHLRDLDREEEEEERRKEMEMSR